MSEPSASAPMSLYDRASASATHILTRISQRPRVAFILGSGLGAFADALEGATRFPYDTIPGFLAPTVPGHKGELVVGTMGGLDLMVMSGRFHYYECCDMDQATFPVRVMRQMGIPYLIVTNSSGGLNPGFGAGDLMVIDDHINLVGDNPLMGHNEDRWGPRFPDMSFAYDPKVREALLSSARRNDVDVRRGVYVGLSGPTYETPAEVRMLRLLGGDAVGMSTVPEVIVANHCGIRVGGVSCVANLGAGLTTGRLSHDEIKESAHKSRDAFVSLLTGTVEDIAAGFDTALLPGGVDAAYQGASGS